MKFTKVIAQAFANKVYKSLKESREESIKNFALKEEEANNVKDLISRLFELSSKLEEVNKALGELYMGFYKQYNETPEQAYKRLVRHIGQQRLPSCPQIDELVDEFLIESVDAVNAEELIAKVIAKYNG